MSRTAHLNALLKHRKEWSTQAEAKCTSTTHKCTLQTQQISCRANNAILSKPNRILQILTIFSAHHSILILLFNTPVFSRSSLHLHLHLCISATCDFKVLISVDKVFVVSSRSSILAMRSSFSRSFVLVCNWFELNTSTQKSLWSQPPSPCRTGPPCHQLLSSPWWKRPGAPSQQGQAGEDCWPSWPPQ